VRVAIHELGHALLGWKDNPDILIEKVTINGLGQALGYAWTRPLEERMLMDHEQAKGRLRMILAGRAAEQVVLGTVSAGAADDLRKAQDLAQHLVVDFAIGQQSGLSRPVSLDVYGREVLTQQGKEDASLLVQEAYDAAVATVETHQAWLMGRAEDLMVQGTLSGDDLFNGLPERVHTPTQGQTWASQLSSKLTSATKKAQALLDISVGATGGGVLVPAAKEDDKPQP
jgi:cell division protease FtsH